MCGICGSIGSNRDGVGNGQIEIVMEMNRLLFQRGPDEEGFYSDERCALAMRRLAIIDLKSGTQPIYSQSRESLIFFNGEIYNYSALRNEMIAKGVSFRTKSDTEVIVNAYEIYGENFVTLLKGMFTFCLYNLKEKKWIIARDKFGEKPLYYYYNRGCLSFSSELGSLLQNPNVPRILNKNVLPYYLLLTYVPEPDTLLHGVKTLPPGHMIVFSDASFCVKKYFEPNYNLNHSIVDLSDAVDIVRPVWEQAVRRQMVSDVPLGAFLSGGIDSSSIVATMQKFSKEPIKTFTVKFADSKYDESHIADAVSKHLGTEHHQIVIENAGFTKELFWELLDRTGLPFPDSSAIPTYYITREIRKYVKVALSGDGGDELFGGYNVFYWYRQILKFQRLPHAVQLFASTILNFLRATPGIKHASILRQLKKAFLLAGYSARELPAFLHSLFSVDEIRSLFPNIPVDLSWSFRYPDNFDTWSDLRKIMYYRVKHDLPLDMLTKVDRMSMANSLEVRAPFLDSDLFDVSSMLPDEFLMTGKTNKVLIRRMMKNELPDVVFSHPKSGFSIPLHKFQNQEFYSLVDELLFCGDEFLGGLIDRKRLVSMVNQLLLVRSDNASSSVYSASHKIWTLLQLAGWMKRYRVAV